MSFGLTLQGVDEDVIEKKVLATAKVLGLTEYLDRKPRELSGGQRQRVAVGRAIIRKVGIFLMDEPLSNLDAKQRVTMRSEITQIHKQTGATTIYVTHDQTEAMTMADRIVVMKDGYIQQIGTPYELYFNPVNMFVAGFIGEPPMNFIRSVVAGGCINLGSTKVKLSDFTSGTVAAGLEGKEIAFGFRPEHVILYNGEKPADSVGISCTVELTELLGDNTNVYIDIDGVASILKIDPHETPKTDSRISFAIPYGHIYLFDAETEKVIRKE